MLEHKVRETEEMINIVGSITPVEIEENSNTKKITVNKEKKNYTHNI